MNVAQELFDGIGGKFGGGQVVFVEVLSGKIFAARFEFDLRKGATVQLEVGEVFEPFETGQAIRD